MGVFLGIDWGGTYIKAGLLDSKGKVIRRIVYASAGLSQKKVFINKIKSLVEEFKASKIKGIGIGAPGIINRDKGFIYYLPNIPGWKNFPLGDVLKKELRLPVYLDNDANVFALAESRYGAAKDASRAIFLTLGTGLGGSIIFNRQILNTEVSALELGHVPISLSNRACGCGGKGCIETFVGSKYLLRRYNSLNKGKDKAKNIKDIFQRALKKEKEALTIWEEFSYALGMFLSGMVNIFNPQVIICGGGVSGAYRIFRPKVIKVIRRQAMWPQAGKVTLRRAKLKDAGIIGAALLAKDKIKG